MRKPYICYSYMYVMYTVRTCTCTCSSVEKGQREMLPLAEEPSAARLRVIQLPETDQEPWEGGGKRRRNITQHTQFQHLHIYTHVHCILLVRLKSVRGH